MESKTVIHLRNVGVRYHRYEERITSLKEYAIRWLSGNRPKFHEFWALQGIDLDVTSGEILGIVGQNGAGKSTLLKVIARVLKPTQGAIFVKGKVAPLLELGTGFDQNLTGRENIYLNGAILGFSKREMDAKFDGIVDFAELWDFIDAPLRTYSTGMVARLAFAIATDVNPDILLLDEVLSVGDAAFQHKCIRRIESFRRRGVTILLVTHNIDVIRSMCDRAVWLKNGRIQAIGDAREVAYLYDEFVYSMGEVTSTGLVFHPHWEITRAELARLLVHALNLSLVVPDSPSFLDVSPTAWYYPYVETVYANGASAGYPDQTFRPHQTVTRSEAITMAVILSKSPPTCPSKPTFQDVKPDAWYFEYVETAHAEGLLEYPEDGLFHPNRGMTRAEAAALAVKLAGYPLQVPNIPSFTDVPRDSWYYPYVETARYHNLMGVQNFVKSEIEPPRSNKSLHP